MTRPRALRVEATGPLVTVQDLGRPGWAHLGVTRSGATDRAALRRANRLVGNVETAPGLEVLLGGLVVTATAHLVVAVSGAWGPLRLDGRPVPREAVLDLSSGSRLEVGPADAGLRACLAVRGGLDVPAVLGSSSRDTLAALGPDPVRAGDVLGVGAGGPPIVAGLPVVDVAPVPRPPDVSTPTVLRALPGPRAEWLDEASRDRFWTARWHVGTDSDRIGLRLDGPPLVRGRRFADAELPSEPLVRGAVQVPPDARPVLFGPDHPTTGGYPVVAVVLDADTDLAGQLAPGAEVCFRRV